MSVSGPGCEHCNYKGTVPAIRDGVNSIMRKPCDACGGLSQFALPPDPMLARIRELEAERDAARSERDEAKAAFLRCAEAIGVVYEADGHASQPGPIDVVERYIREAVRNADARIEMVERIAAAAGRVGVADADDVREGLAWEAIETLANRAAELTALRATLVPLVERLLVTFRDRCDGKPFGDLHYADARDALCIAAVDLFPEVKLPAAAGTADSEGT